MAAKSSATRPPKRSARPKETAPLDGAPTREALVAQMVERDRELENARRENSRLLAQSEEAVRLSTATRDILKVIASSANDVRPALEMLAESVCQLW